MPRNYEVEVISDKNLQNYFEKSFLNCDSSIIIIDKNIYNLYPFFKQFDSRCEVIQIEAIEENKVIETAIQITKKFKKNNVTKSSKIYVIGGGIIQDVSAFACAMYKRGVPWIYLPTTLLSMSDSCIGAKCGLNFENSKNMHALFSAPQKILIHKDFLKTLDEKDIYSGIGEIIKLHITGGPFFTQYFTDNKDNAYKQDLETLVNLSISSLLVKKTVVEFDEFELDIRRSMNYGHSLGHAIESIVDYEIPHGTAVLMGILIENELSVLLNYLDRETCQNMFDFSKAFIPVNSTKRLQEANFENILQLLKNDKKTQGKYLFTPIIKTIGEMAFLKLELSKESEEKILQSIKNVLDEL